MAEKAKKTAPARILVVEDDWDVLEVLKLMLEDEGHRVVTAKDGRAALSLVADAAKPFDMIVMDVSMPEVSGIEVAQTLRADAAMAEVRIVFHTGLEESWVRERFTEYDLFLTKAHDADVLIRRIADLLDEPRVPLGQSAADVACFGTDDLLRGQRALRAALGLHEETLTLAGLVEQLSAEIAQLRRVGKSDDAIAELLGDAIGRPVAAAALAAMARP